MAIMNRRDSVEIAQLIQAAITPLLTKVENKVDRLDEKVDQLAQNHATRADLEKLRQDMQATYVPRDSYEARHAALISRDTQIETDCRQRDKEMQDRISKILELIGKDKENLETRLANAQQAQLSERDQLWMRWTQVGAILAVAVSVIGLFLDHIQFH